MILTLNDDMFYYIIDYLDKYDIYNLRLSYKNSIPYWTFIVLLWEHNYLDDFYDTDDN